jgi:hypothetical protein
MGNSNCGHVLLRVIILMAFKDLIGPDTGENRGPGSWNEVHRRGQNAEEV